MMSICVVCLLGLPGAGKTKLAYSLYSLPDARVSVIEYDRILNFDSFKNGTWKLKRKKILESVKNKIRNVTGRVLIVLDDNFFYRSMRHECFLIARDIGASFCQIYLRTNIVQCLKNNLSRCYPVPTEVVLRMNFIFEPPDPKIIHWENQTLVTDFDPNLEQIISFLNVSWNNNIKPVIQITNQPQTQNKIHYADLALRKHIARIYNDSQNQNLGKELTIKKSALIKKIKTGEICLPEDIGNENVNLYYKFFENYF